MSVRYLLLPVLMLLELALFALALIAAIVNPRMCEALIRLADKLPSWEWYKRSKEGKCR